MQFFANLNTKAKIFLGFLVVIVINLIIVISSISALSTSQQAALLIDDTLAHAFQRINKLQTAVQTLNLEFTKGLNYTDSSSSGKALYADAPAMLNEIENRVNALNVNFSSDPTYRSYVNSLVSSSHAIVDKTREEILPQLNSDTLDPQLLNIYARDILPEIKTSLTSSSTLINMQTEMCLQASAPAASPRIIYIISVLAAVTVVLAILVALYIANYISAQVSSATKYVVRMAEGDFNFDVPITSSDEFGTYRENLKKMRNSVGHILALTQNECGKLQDSMNLLHKSASTIVEAVSNVQNQAITVAAASDEMVSTTSDIARNCESAASGSNMCKEITGDGVAQVSRAVDNIRQQAEHTKDNASKIESLARQTHDIGSIVSTIDDIAAQTNLLALNAAIEAARAGEAGRGFAVVADEVRALASRTTKSTQEISKMVKNIQDEARMATESINSSVANMDTVAEDAQNVMQVLNDITDHVTEVNNQITQIATATEEQTTATSEISSNAQNVNNASSEVTQNATEQQQSIENTLEDLNSLSQALAFFKLRDQDFNGVK